VLTALLSSRLVRYDAVMGPCLSTVLPRRVLGRTRREGSPGGSPRTPHSDDSDGKELPGEANGNSLPESVDSNYLPNGELHSKHHTNGTPSKHFPDEEHNKRLPDDTHDKHLPDDVHDETKDVEAKRRALLVGITYSSPSNTWSPLDGPHDDVDQYQDLLISA
jgi:hypothetical protein